MNGGRFKVTYKIRKQEIGFCIWMWCLNDGGWLLLYLSMNMI